MSPEDSARAQQLGKAYGGNFAGSGIAPAVANSASYKGVYFDPNSSQHFTVNNGQPHFITPPTSSYNPNASNISKIGHFIGGAASEIGHIAGGAASWLGHTLTTAVEAPIKFGYDFGKSTLNFTQGAVDSYLQDHQTNQLTQKQQNLTSQWKSGQISTKEYQSGLIDIKNQFNDLNKQIESNQARLQTARQTAQASAEPFVNTVEDVITIATGGLGTLPMMLISKFLTSSAAIDIAAQTIGRTAVNKAVFDGLSDGAKAALQKSAAEVIAAAPEATAGQIARASAINLAFKYPLYFSWASGTGTELYHELDQKKYGDAIRTGAFNAALLLSGGPIGYALKYGGKAVKSATLATFGRTEFVDELSKQLFGDSAVLYEAAKNNPEYIKGLSTLEKTSLSRTGGDAIAAARDVVSGEYSVDGFNAINQGAKGWLENNTNWAQASKEFADEAKRLGIPNVVAGRWTISQGQNVMKEFASVDEQSLWPQIWEKIKAKYPNSALANNPNLESQMQHYFLTSRNGAELAAKINGIDAGSLAKGIDSKIIEKWGPRGFVPVTIPEVKRPVIEGTGQVASRFANPSDELFIRSVQPLPVLKTVGAMFTRLGLSPQGSAQRVYQLFNENLARNLKESGVVPEIMGEDAAQTTDLMIKKLSSYAKDASARKGLSKIPITDLRMLTTKEIQKALDVSQTEANAIQKAISKAFMDVPLSVRGFGDKLVDFVYSKPTGAFQRRYLRLQGAARFGYNPFFQYLRVIPKTETLASFEGGGFISTIFKGQGKQLNQIRDYLRENKFLNKQSGFTSSTDIASEFSGLGYNLNKKLLPMQEKSIAGLLNSQAEKVGMDWKTFIDQNPQQVRDTIQMIAEYDKRSSFLNSPLARTLNIAFFPFRFDTKVAMIMTRNLAKADLATQVGVVNGLLQAHNYLNTDEGKAWYAANSDVIGLFKYITPVASLNEVFHSLLPGNDHSLGNFGELGGLPFGWIPQLLDSEGLTHFNQPGASPKTGALDTEYIPTSTRGQVATAIQDFISGLFSYPGATVGLPSKTKATSTIARGVTGANSSDFQKVVPNPTPEQQAYQEALGNVNAAPISSIPQSTQPQGFTLPDYSVPTPVTPLTKEQVAAMKSSGASGRRPKAHALPIPPRQ